jgi:hypothetical protein
MFPVKEIASLGHMVHFALSKASLFYNFLNIGAAKRFYNAPGINWIFRDSITAKE